MITIPAVMKGVQLTGHGDPEKLVLRTDIPVPTPGPNDVLIKVGAAGVNNTDLNTRVGWYSKSNSSSDAGWAGNPLTFPRIQGIDVCGRVVAVGAKVDTPVLETEKGWVSIANQKHYISIYTCKADHLVEFKRNNPRVKTGKGCINLKPTATLPLKDLELVICKAMDNSS